jgi:putative selenate reductase
VADLIPQPFDRLLARTLAELERSGSIFGLPRRSFWKARPGLDLAVRLPGGRAGTPLGPAAGPHTQLAPNLVLAWLAGSRVLELKTVQVMDRLEIPRPCIDAPGEGYNVEWSQELRLEDSARQYAIAWYLVHILKARGVAGEAGPDTIFDGSVGYDLAGIRSDAVARFLDTLHDAGPLLAGLRAALPGPLRPAADVPVPPCIVDTVTLSSFHGCPPGEIERIVEHLFSRHHVHVVVKLNPTLLGYDAVDELLHARLGYAHVRLDRGAFEKDLQWDDALPLLDRLAGAAKRTGRSLGVKFSNTLVVRNTRGTLAGEHAYMSGPPLHVIATALASRFAEATGGRYPLSFSAGIDADNVADAVAAGFSPVTTCTDLLRPTGYRRLPRYLKAIEADMERLGVANLPAYVLARAGAGPGTPVAAAARANLAALAARAAGDTRYAAAEQAAPAPDRAPLPVLDCDSCNNCALVCPNAAFFSVPTPPALLASGAAREERQWLVFADACNACGNCDTHCPQAGGPHRIKPRYESASGTLVAEGQDAGTLSELLEAARRSPGWLVPDPAAAAV